MLPQPFRLASRIVRGALDVALPSDCVACGGKLPLRGRHGSCCASCWSDLPRLGAACRSCASPLPVEDGALCLACVDRPMPTDWVAAWGAYRGRMERVLHAFKFERHDFLDVELGKLLAERFVRQGDVDFDAVVPVPMHRRKFRARGYNQAELLARQLSGAAGIAFDRRLLKKTTDNETQSLLPREERPRNVRRVFEAHRDVRGRSILLVDDICTTGETLRAAAKALLDQGARRVAAITVARA